MIFAIDPGTTHSGWVLLHGSEGVMGSGFDTNHDLLKMIQESPGVDVLAIEMIAGMGMTVGQTTFETVRWIGRFQQAWRDPEAVVLVYRRQVKSELCGSQKAKDKNIRQALIDRIGPQGTKKSPGPTYGVSGHAWQALAVAVTAEALAAVPEAAPAARNPPMADETLPF